MKSILRRILAMIPVLIGVVILIFIMMRIIPGDPVTMMLGEHVNPQTVERMTASLGLDRPIVEQFFLYIWNALHGDLGYSISMKRDVADLIAIKFPHTVQLALMAAVFAWILGLISGIIAAVRQNRLLDRLFMGFSLAGVSMPIFMTAMLLQYLLAFKVKLFPLTSAKSTFVSMILPAVALGWNSAGSIARMTRSSLVEVMQADYIDTARAKGLRRGAVIIKHALKNSLLPVVTMMALQLSSMMSGAVITETIFGIDGIGKLATDAIGGRDMALLQGTVLLTTIIVILGNLIADLLYSVLDPRIRKEA